MPTFKNLVIKTRIVDAITNLTNTTKIPTMKSDWRYKNQSCHCPLCGYSTIFKFCRAKIWCLVTLLREMTLFLNYIYYIIANVCYLDIAEEHLDKLERLQKYRIRFTYIWITQI